MPDDRNSKFYGIDAVFESGDSVVAVYVADRKSNDSNGDAPVGKMNGSAVCRAAGPHGFLHRNLASPS